jgi:hypothetical protein
MSTATISTATHADLRVTHARVSLPAWGIPWTEVSIDEEATLSGRVALKVADLTLSGTVISGGPGPVGRSKFRIAGGAGGWGKTLPARSYTNDAAVKADTVLTDLARESGETVDLTTVPTAAFAAPGGQSIQASIRVGPAFVREKAPAARALEQLFPSSWYVGESDGVTRIGKRPVTTVTTPVTVRSVDRARRVVVLSAESIATLVPGCVVEGIEAVDVMHELAPGAGLVTTIWGAGITATSRRLTLLRRLLEQLDPFQRFRGLFEYRVVTQDQLGRLNLQPVRVSTGMPDLQHVPVRPGIPGARADHFLGACVLVTFLDASPARPVVTGFADDQSGGFLPTRLELDATTELILGGGVLGVARQTDAVVAGPFGGTITGGSTKVKAN